MVAQLEADVGAQQRAVGRDHAALRPNAAELELHVAGAMLAVHLHRAGGDAHRVVEPVGGDRG